MDEDLEFIVNDLKYNNIRTNRVVVYCHLLNMCSTIYAHLLFHLGNLSYYPPGASEISDNQLVGMFHSQTHDHNKEVILLSFGRSDGIVRVLIATSVIGMGVNLIGVNATIHYGAPRFLDDYFQKIGRAGRSGEPSTWTLYWTPSDAPLRKDLSDPRNVELAAIHRYLQNDTHCRRFQLLSYFGMSVASTLSRLDPHSCCDVCALRNTICS